MIKILFLILLFIYGLIIASYCFKFPISYKLTNGNDHELKIDHDFTEKEREDDKKSYLIRQLISNTLLYSSSFMFLFSYFISKRNLFKPLIILKIAMYISSFIAILLFLINGVHFYLLVAC